MTCIDAFITTRLARAYACAILVVLSLPVLRAEPEITASALRVGSSPKLTACDWVYLNYTLKNPDAVERTVRLSLRPSNGGAQAIFEKEVTLAPQTFMRGRELVTASPVDEYALSLFRGKERVARTTLFCRHTDPEDQLSVFLLNDDQGFGGLSDLMRSHAFTARVAVASCASRDAPHHWTGYGRANVVALGGPSYRDMSAMQFSALIEYVHRGGTVVFVYPRGALQALSTPLRELLPATPVRIRNVELLPPLDNWAAAWYRLAKERGITKEVRIPYEAPEGIEFLETVPDAMVLVTLADREFPICCWRSHGLGRVGLVAVSASSDLIKKSAVLVPLWQHITSWSQAPFALTYHENSELLQPLMAKLTGFQIPSVTTVGRTLLLYALVLMVVLIGGYSLRKHAHAWVAAALIGLLVTGAIFFVAFRQNRNRPIHSAGIIDLRTSTGERTTGHAIFSLFSRTDARPTLFDTNPENGIRALPPAVRGKRKSPMNAPLMINRNRDRAELPDIYLQALKPRHFASVYTREPVELGVEPELHLTSRGVELALSPIPAGISGKHPRAWVLLPSGLLPVSIKAGNFVSLEAGARTFGADTFQRALAEYLGCGRFPSPSLAVLSQWDARKHGLTLNLGEFQTNGFHVEFIPLSLHRDQETVRVPPEMYVMKPATAYAKLAMQNGKWIAATLRRQSLVIPMRAMIPPFLGDGTINTAWVDLKLSTPGENITWEIAFSRTPILSAAPAGINEEMEWAEAVKADSVSGSTAMFTDLPAKGISSSLQPDGTIVFLIRLSQKRFMAEHADAERANVWKILDVRLQTLTSLPTAGDREKEL